MPDELLGDERLAVGWAWATRSATGKTLRDRIEQGANPRPNDEELVAIRAEWEAAGRPEPPKLHVHRNPVIFSDGSVVIAASFVTDNPYERKIAPSYGLYFDPRWDPPWHHEHVLWPDFGRPKGDELHLALGDLLARARSGESVEIGCLGGHGRTGTALACIAGVTGTPWPQTVEWVRSTYCEEAVETPDQRQFVLDFGDRFSS
jgi:hypothetical protein